jgi:hypothetical protein
LCFLEVFEKLGKVENSSNETLKDSPSEKPRKGSTICALKSHKKFSFLLKLLESVRKFSRKLIIKILIIENAGKCLNLDAF